MKAILALLVTIAAAVPARADTGLKVVTQKGYVSFVVADDWAVLSMPAAGPVSAAVFQLPNPADEGTSDSTNLSLMLYDLSTAQGRAAFETPVRQYGAAKPEEKKVNGWSVYQQTATQGPTEYTILDAKRKDVADVAAGVRLAWPHLPRNPPDFDKTMGKTFQSFLESISGHLGPYKPQEGEVVRRPEN